MLGSFWTINFLIHWRNDDKNKLFMNPFSYIFLFPLHHSLFWKRMLKRQIKESAGPLFERRARRIQVTRTIETDFNSYGTHTHAHKSSFRLKGSVETLCKSFCVPFHAKAAAAALPPALLPPPIHKMKNVYANMNEFVIYTSMNTSLHNRVRREFWPNYFYPVVRVEEVPMKQRKTSSRSYR